MIYSKINKKKIQAIKNCTSLSFYDIINLINKDALVNIIYKGDLYAN